MAATGVLPFIRGVDLSGNDFKVTISSFIRGFYNDSLLLAKDRTHNNNTGIFKAGAL